MGMIRSSDDIFLDAEGFLQIAHARPAVVRRFCHVFHCLFASLISLLSLLLTHLAIVNSDASLDFLRLDVVGTVEHVVAVQTTHAFDMKHGKLTLRLFAQLRIS